MLPSEITTTMEFSDPKYPLAGMYSRTLETYRIQAGKKKNDKEYLRELTVADSSVSKRIDKAVRARCTVSEVAMALGVKEKQAYNLIAHPSLMSREQVAKLATLLDVTLTELRGEPQVLSSNTVATYYDHLTTTDKAIVSSLISRLHSVDHGVSWV